MGFHISEGQLLWIIAALFQVDVFDQSCFRVDKVLQRILSQSIMIMATRRRDVWVHIQPRIFSSFALTIAASPRILSRKAYRHPVL